MTDLDRLGVVVIGRNEGERLKRCLRSVPPGMPVVYVDSDSSDGSCDFARAAGMSVVELDTRTGFTAARARNEGWRYLVQQAPQIAFIQFVDGDCEIAGAWFDEALPALQAEKDLAVVFGRRRERFPARSIYNQMCDDEWNVPIGIADSCGGDALFRASALKQAGGYSDDLIAGEEPDLCLRLRGFGWLVQRINAEMTLHDANILTFASWWKRAKRSGFAYAEHVWRHKSNAIPVWRRQLMSILFWGLLLPAATLSLALFLLRQLPLAAVAVTVLLASVYALQTLRIAVRKRRSGSDWCFALPFALLMMVGKFAEVTGAIKCWSGHYAGRRQQLIEYK